MENKFKLNQTIYTMENGVLKNGIIAGIKEERKFVTNENIPDEIVYTYMVVRSKNGFVTNKDILHRGFGVYSEALPELELACRWFTNVDDYACKLKKLIEEMTQKK